MEGITLILGILGFVLILLYLFKILKPESERNAAVDVLRLMLLLAAIGTLILIPKATIDDQYVCQPVINETHMEGDNTTYVYSNYCYIKNGSTPAIFTEAVGWIYRILMTYLVGYLAWRALLWLFESFGWRLKGGNDEKE